jgi:hypothetical protein
MRRDGKLEPNSSAIIDPNSVRTLRRRETPFPYPKLGHAVAGGSRLQNLTVRQQHQDLTGPCKTARAVTSCQRAA